MKAPGNPTRLGEGRGGEDSRGKGREKKTEDVVRATALVLLYHVLSVTVRVTVCVTVCDCV